MTRLPAFLRKTLSISGSRHSALDTARSRIAIISAAFVLSYLLVGARVFDLTIIQHRLKESADTGQPVSVAANDHFRADITDRNGVILATTLEAASLAADPALIPEPEKVAEQLCALFPGLVYGEVLQKLQKKGRFVWIKRSLTPDEQYSVLELGQPGLKFQTERRRIYPQGAMAAHFVGYTDIDGKGLAGVERSFDKLLDDGGEPLALTLDIRLQHVLRRELAGAVKDFSAIGGAGAIVDIASGEILAASSMPDFDPHDPGAASPEQIFNNLTLGVFEQGSTFKIFSTAALIETHNVPMDYRFDAREPLKRGRFTISDYHAEKRELTVPEVFMYSSNIGSALMGEMVGTSALKEFYYDLGLMEPMRLEIDEIGKPILPNPWGEITTVTASYGHGISVTPLQTVMAAASIVNGGTRVQPTLILGDKKSQESHDVRVVSPQTAHRMRQLMRLVVTDGTGKSANVPGYNVGGKTGTAEKKRAGAKGYDQKRRVSSFLGFFPMDAPRYAVFIMVDEPKGNKASWGYATGGWVAAPAVGRIIKAMGPLLGLTPESSEEEQEMSASLKQYISYKDEGI